MNFVNRFLLAQKSYDNTAYNWPVATLFSKARACQSLLNIPKAAHPLVPLSRQVWSQVQLWSQSLCNFVWLEWGWSPKLLDGGAEPGARNLGSRSKALIQCFPIFFGLRHPTEEN